MTIDNNAYWRKMKKNRKLLYKLIQLMCFVILGLLMINIFNLVDIIQGTGRVINYSGIIRGGTQRLVKLELAGYPRNDLVENLDEILSNLENGGGPNKLDKLDDSAYLDKLAILRQSWPELKAEIIAYRLDPGNEETVLQTSEAYFTLANDVVGTAELYMDKKSAMLNDYEIVVGILLLFLIFTALQQAYSEINLIRKNRELETVAYIDRTTGLPGRRSCEEKIWTPMDLNEAPHCAIMFDLNNLKTVNDQLGYIEGDRLIKGFSDILNKVSNEHVFVGRYGGDEFIMFVRGYEEEKINQLLDEILLQTEAYNTRYQEAKIKYAVGYEFEGVSLQKMLEKADEKMYINKKFMKEMMGNISG